MALIDVECEGGHRHEVYRKAADWPLTPPCPECGASTTQIHLPRGRDFLADPVVVYQAPDGTYRFPGDTSGPGSHKYDRFGYTRIECRTFADVRSLERKINAADRAAAGPILERLSARDEQREHDRRSELFHQMASMSASSRDLCRRIVDANNRKPKRRSHSGSFYIEAYD
jgi:hypothetical protein